MHQYPRWKYAALLIALFIGGLYALPNLFGEDVAVQISRDSGDPLDAPFADRAKGVLAAASIPVKEEKLENGRLLLTFASEEVQLKAQDTLKQGLGQGFVIALNLAPRTPAWLTAIGAKPMALGLDLRGGVYFLLEVDMDAALTNARERVVSDMPRFLRGERLHYSGIKADPNGVTVSFRDAKTRDDAHQAIAKEFTELTLTDAGSADEPAVQGIISQQELKRIQEFALKQNLTTLRNRVNELGVAEPVVQQQGANRIVIQLPGVQDSAQAKRILGKTATLEYRLVAESTDAQAAARTGVAPPGTELFHDRDGRPVLLNRDQIASGDQLVDATSGIDSQSGSPAVFVTLDGKGAKSMFETTQKNLGKPMAVLFIENKVESHYENGQEIRQKVKTEQVISVATIRDVFGKRFQTTGLGNNEARDLALLLRAGALAAPVDIVEERTVGPSLGADNIRRGFEAAVLGLALVASFMFIYYRVFGLFAIMALVLNLIMIVAGLSLLQATLTMPGIAGMVLTMGIAVDANVLIYERIREELRRGSSPHAAIQAGYDRAFLTIADANITVLIGAIVLFALGAGPVKGFAVTLALGIMISQFTAIVGSRSLAQIVFGKRRMKDLPIW